MSDLEKEAAELRAQLTEALGGEIVDDQDGDEVVIVTEEDDSPEDEPEEKAETEKKSTEEDEEPEKLNYPSYAKLRREKKAERERADALAAELAALKAAPAPVQQAPTAQSQPAPGNPFKKDENYEGWLEYELAETQKLVGKTATAIEEQRQQQAQSNLMQEASRELGQHMAKFKEKQPDFDAAIEHGSRELRRAYKLNGMNERQIEAALDRKVIEIAALAAKAGEDPAEALYYYAVDELGYVQKDETEEEKKPGKPDLDKVAANRQRNAGMVGAKGRGGSANVTRETASDYSPTEWAKLPMDERKRIIAGR